MTEDLATTNSHFLALEALPLPERPMEIQCIYVGQRILQQPTQGSKLRFQCMVRVIVTIFIVQDINIINQKRHVEIDFSNSISQVPAADQT